MKPRPLSSLPPALAALNRAELAKVPHPRTCRLDAGAIPPARIVSKRRSFDATGILARFGIPAPVREYRFHDTRKWRFDLAWADQNLAVEIDGGLFVNGGHSRGKAREGDYAKDAAAMALGWRVLRCSTGQMRSGEACRWILAILKSNARTNPCLSRP